METFFKNISAEDGTTGKLVQDLNMLLSDAEELVSSTGGKLATKSKDELTAVLEKLRASCGRIEKRATEGALGTDRFIRKKPYQSAGIALGIGLLLGALLGRE
jgi:ElaB/YqjD/DUF883 family membrane-anchored ribosome-binding protein